MKYPINSIRAVTSQLLMASILLSCSAHSKTTCSNPDAADAACKLDARRTPVFSGASAEADIPQCTADREGNVYYVKATGGFKVCSEGVNKDVSVVGAQGPQGPQGPAGEAGTAGSNGTNGSHGTVGANGPPDLSIAGVIAPGASLSLTHNLNSMIPAAFALFARNGLLRAVSQYKNDVGRKAITVSGAGWDGNYRPQVVSLSNGNVAVLRGDWPEQATHSAAVDIYSDEGEIVKLNAKVLPALNTVRGIAVSNGLLVIYEPSGTTDEYFTVISNDGATVIAPTIFATSAGNNRIKDLKKLSNGHVVVAEQAGGNAAAFHILDPINGMVVASNNSAATSSDARTNTVPLDGKFMLFFTDVALVPNTRVAIFNNDGTPNTAAASAGLGNETILGSERIASDRIAVVTSSFNNLSSTLFGLNLNIIRATTKYSPLSADSASPISLGNGNWTVCSTRSEGYCISFDREGNEIFRNGDLFASSASADFSAVAALGNQGRFAVLSHDDGNDTGVVNFLQPSVGRLDLEVVDANTVRVVNRTVESLAIVLGINQ